MRGPIVTEGIGRRCALPDPHTPLARQRQHCSRRHDRFIRRAGSEAASNHSRACSRHQWGPISLITLLCTAHFHPSIHTHCTPTTSIHPHKLASSTFCTTIHIASCCTCMLSLYTCHYRALPHQQRSRKGRRARALALVPPGPSGAGLNAIRY